MTGPQMSRAPRLRIPGERVRGGAARTGLARPAQDGGFTGGRHTDKGTDVGNSIMLEGPAESNREPGEEGQGGPWAKWRSSEVTGDTA